MCEVRAVGGRAGVAAAKWRGGEAFVCGRPNRRRGTVRYRADTSRWWGKRNCPAAAGEIARFLWIRNLSRRPCAHRPSPLARLSAVSLSPFKNVSSLSSATLSGDVVGSLQASTVLFSAGVARVPGFCGLHQSRVSTAVVVALSCCGGGA